MVTIAVDAMGGDHHPKPEVEGAIRATQSLNVRVILVGREQVLKKEIEKHPGWNELPIEIRNANDVVTMEDSAGQSLRHKKDSSIRVACRLVRDGVAEGVVSAGNTGAVMATAKTVMGMIAGVDRPALAQAFPTVKRKPAVIIDVGANVDCTPNMLAQFAIMGEVYFRALRTGDNHSPSVGLLSIGEEEHKGNELTKAALPLLKTLPINFIGNVEGRDFYTGVADVIVCDGFIGNVALKVSEGLVDVIKQMLKEELEASMLRKVGALLSKGGFADFKKRVDYSEFGGAPLLGVKGICIICHGRSNSNAIKNAIRIARDFAEGEMNKRIESDLGRWAASMVAAK